nr:hypothetical protein CFP56_70149 [Quercus suber]
MTNGPAALVHDTLRLSPPTLSTGSWLRSLLQTHRPAQCCEALHPKKRKIYATPLNISTSIQPVLRPLAPDVMSVADGQKPCLTKTSVFSQLPTRRNLSLPRLLSTNPPIASHRERRVPMNVESPLNSYVKSVFQFVFESAPAGAFLDKATVHRVTGVEHKIPTYMILSSIQSNGTLNDQTYIINSQHVSHETLLSEFLGADTLLHCSSPFLGSLLERSHASVSFLVSSFYCQLTGDDHQVPPMGHV